MTLVSLHRLHWLLISILIGVGLGYFTRVAPSDLKFYGSSLNNRHSFEAAVMEHIGDAARFKDIEIRRCQVPGIGDVDVVSGLYCNGKPEEKDQAYHWKPTFFVASIPYRPGDEIDGPTVANVRDFLTELKVPFIHAWWRSHSMATWLIASVTMIGLVWPTLLIRIAYGRWTRPPGEKGISLWNVRTTRGGKKPMTSPTMAGMRDEHSGSPPMPASAVESMPPLFVAKPLSSEPLPAVAVNDAAHAEFGAKADDFYPTEKRGHAH